MNRRYVSAAELKRRQWSEQRRLLEMALLTDPKHAARNQISWRQMTRPMGMEAFNRRQAAMLDTAERDA